jgi:type IV fimbrial biogenesis protein FimT
MTPRKNMAFSLPELLITILLMSIMASIALPGLLSLKQKSQIETLRNTLHSSLHNARLQAVLQRRSVEMCATNLPGECSSEWHNGWQSHYLGAPQIPFEINRSGQDNTLKWAGFSKTIRFHANGTSPASNGRFFQCHNDSIAWQLIINRQGRIRLGTHKENQDQVLRCKP